MALAVAATVALAFGLRSLGWEEVFPGDGRVVFSIGDSHGHARRAVVTFLRFPALLVFDPYLNYPDGAPPPTPPLYNYSVAAAARLFGSDQRVFEHVQAWASPVLGSLVVIPVALAAASLGGPASAAGAGLLYALFPVAALSSQVGDADHHAAVALIGACMLAISLALARPGRRRFLLLGVGLFAARLAMFLTWGGSLGYAVVLDGTLLAVAALTGNARLSAVEGASALATGAALLPVVQVLPAPAWGAWSAAALSYLQVAFAFGVAGVAALLALAEELRPVRSPVARAVRLALAGLLGAAVFLAIPPTRAGLLSLLEFLRESSSAPRTAIAELLPLFPMFGRPALQPAQQSLGWLAYAVPLVPALLAWLAWREPARRAQALLLAGWTAALGALFVSQYRFGTDYAACGAVAFAWIGVELLRRGRSRFGLSARGAAAAAVAIGVLLLWPALAIYAGLARASLSSLEAERTPRQRMLATPAGSLTLFLERVRNLTPETSGWLGEAAPEYGVLCPANLGHAVAYVAHRATPASGYAQLAGAQNFSASQAFFETRREEDALRTARRLRSRFVITAEFPGARPGSMEARLQDQDGAASGGSPRLVHFRLVTEGPRGGRPLSDLFGFPHARRAVPYKLFEIVPGALLRVPGPPRAPVEVSVEIRTPTRRRFAYTASAQTGLDGFAFVRVPYAQNTGYPAGPRGPYRIQVGGRALSVAVTERDVLEGATVAVAADAAAPAPLSGTRGAAPARASAVDTQPPRGSSSVFARGPGAAVRAGRGTR